MKPLVRLLPIVAALALFLPTPSDACVIQIGARGAFVEVGEGARCLTFVDAMGNTYEILEPSAVWKAGMKGLVFAQHAGSGRCTTYPALRICTFQAESARTFEGTLARRDDAGCAGFVVEAATEAVRIVNCEDFGAALCDPKRVGRLVRIEASAAGPAGGCAGGPRVVVLSYEFPD